MRFIELTSDNTGREIHVRADCIRVVSTYVNDDEGERYTKVYLGTNESDVLHVTESPEEVRLRIRDSERMEIEDANDFLRRVGKMLGAEEEAQRFQAGEEPPSDWEKVLAGK